MRRLTYLALLALVLAACGTATTFDAANDPGDTSTSPAQPIRVLVRPEPTVLMEAVLLDINDPSAEVKGRVHGTPFYVVEVPPGTDVDAFLADLNADNRVVIGELDRKLSAPEGGGATLPVGGEFFDEVEIAFQPALGHIGADIAGTRATGLGVRVAVVDTGVVESHQSLLGRIEPGGWDFVDDDPYPKEQVNGEDDDGDGFIDEGFGHGTFVSSLILAVAPDVTILPYRVLDSDCNGLVSSVAEAITRAADAGVHAINLSLGMEHHVHTIGEAIKYARNKGVVVIASAGNTGNEEITYPATIAFALAVTAVDPQDVLADFASYGSDVDVSAPGLELLGAYPIGPNVAAKGSGTSFSTALVTGGFALLRERFPGLGHGDLVEHLKLTAFDITRLNPGLEEKMGTGRLDLNAATE